MTFAGTAVWMLILSSTVLAGGCAVQQNASGATNGKPDLVTESD